MTEETLAVVKELIGKIGEVRVFEEGERVSVTVGGVTATGTVAASNFGLPTYAGPYPVVLDGTGQQVDIPREILERIPTTKRSQL